MKVFLIGMPGSGKSLLGPDVAEKLNVPFVDLDHEIENFKNLKVSDIFEKYGEDYFRNLETEFLRKYSNCLTHFVISTGGGTPCFHNNMKFIKETGVAVFLNTTCPTNLNDRPLLKSISWEDLKIQRLEYYNQAQIVSSANLSEIVSKLTQYVNI